MRIDEVTSLGNGWYSGKGGLVFPWIFDVAVNVEFARLRVNTDNVQIDGEVETSYDEGEGSIGNTNELDYGGSKPEQGGVQFANNVEVDFTVPDMPQVEYNEESGKLTITDENGGNPQTIDVPKNDGKSSFPMVITDKDGNKYQINEEVITAYGTDSVNVENIPIPDTQIITNNPSVTNALNLQRGTTLLNFTPKETANDAFEYFRDSLQVTLMGKGSLSNYNVVANLAANFFNQNNVKPPKIMFDNRLVRGHIAVFAPIDDGVIVFCENFSDLSNEYDLQDVYNHEMVHYLHYSKYRVSYDSATRDDFHSKERKVINNIDMYPENKYQDLLKDEQEIYRKQAPVIYVREAFAKMLELRYYKNITMTDLELSIFNKIIHYHK